MIKKLLLKIARAMVEVVLSKIAEEINKLENLVRAPIEAMVRDVVGGIWIGDGADKFVDVVTSMVIPGSVRIIDSCGVTTTSINRSMEIIDAADQKVVGLVNNLESTFQGIF